MTLIFLLTTSTSAGPIGGALADFANGVQLEIELPPGFDPADLVSDANVPLDFVTVPEPDFALALCFGMLALARTRPSNSTFRT